jgi:N6-L-threonylcarbamoyladenine synthase
MRSNPIILAIDTSCDETSVAVLEGRKVLSSIRNSQVDIHAQFGGVVPDVARRAHEENIQGVYEEALRRSKKTIEDIEYVAVTIGPGLAIDLEVGINFAKEISLENKIPFVAVNHMEGHLLSPLLLNSKGNGEEVEGIFPALALLVSGKHTEIIYVKEIGMYEKLGETLDDAAGEAFDKVGRMLDFGYPGGPVVSEFAKRGKVGEIVLPIPMERSGDLNFSFSGLKTAALYKTKELRELHEKDSVWVYDFCRAFVDSVTTSLTQKLSVAIESYPKVRSVLVGGGVFQSEELLKRVGKTVRNYNLKFLFPRKEYRGDNAAMIGIVANYKIQRGEFIKDRKEIEEIDRVPRLSL